MPPEASRSCPCTTPSPTAAACSPSPTTDNSRTPQWARAARVGIPAAARSASTPSAAWCPTGSRTPPPTGPGCWPGGPNSPRPTSALACGHRFDVLDVDGPAGEQAIRTLAAEHGLRSSGPLVRTGGGGWHFYLVPTGLGNINPANLEHVDWRGRGGYVVAPPSRHASGHPYRWVAGRDLDMPVAEVPSVLCVDPLQHPRQSLGAEQLTHILIEHRPPDRRGIEEGHRLAVAQDLLQRLRDGCEVDGGPLGAGVVEDVLLGQDRLAAAGWSHHQVDRMGREAAAQDRVQLLVAAGQAPASRRPGRHLGPPALPRRNALAPSRSLTAETSCSGSSGFCRNASAPASRAASLLSRVEMARIGASLRCLSCRHSASPLPPEISRSITVMLGVSSWTFWVASAATSAEATS